ncbi:MAG: hypothetical protein AB1473_00430 [Thermodesulfobacteriota bacterium]
MTDRDRARTRKPFWQKISVSSEVLLMAAAILAALTVLMFGGEFSSFRTTIPSNEEMIANFQQNRADFERLAQIYREDLSVPTSGRQLQPTPEVQAIMSRIHVTSVNGDQMIWLPPDVCLREAELRADRGEKAVIGAPEARKFSGVIFGYERRGVTGLMSMSNTYKLYYYFPLVPVAENGELVISAAPARAFSCVTQTTNKCPPYFEGLERECVCTQIEPQWFIQECREEFQD